MPAITDINWPVLWVVVAYLGFIISVAIYAGRKQQGMSDFFAGGMSIPWWVVALSITAATMSGWGFVGMPGMVYSTGWAFGAVIGVGAATGMVLSFYLLAKPMRKCAQIMGAITVPDLLAMRYNSKHLRLIAAIGILLGTIGYQAAQYKALANMLQAIFPLTYIPALFLGVGILTVYTIKGGMKSVAWADFFETLVMLFAAGFAFFYGMYLCGGLSTANATLAAKNPDWVQLIHTHGGPMSFLSFLSVLLVLGIGYLGQPHVMSKFYQVDNKVGLKRAAFFAIATFLIVIMAYYTGIWQRVLELQGKTAVISTPDLAAPMFVSQQLPPIMAGVTFAGVIAAIMSTSGAFILVASSAITRDIIQNYILDGKKLDGPTQLKWSRMATAGVIIVTTLVSIKPITLVGWLGLASWGIYAATLTTPLVLGLWWRRATKPAAIAASLVGLIGGIGLFTLKMLKIYTSKIDPMGVAFAAAILTFVVVTYMTKPEANAYFEEQPEIKEAA